MFQRRLTALFNLFYDCLIPQLHKSAWPFMEPVDPEEAPDYYKVIKEPMGKFQIYLFNVYFLRNPFHSQISNK